MNESIVLQSLKNPLQIERALCKSSLFNFVKNSWEVVQAGYEYQDNWHIKVICNYLENTQNFENPNRIKNLIIGLPPRCMKSLLVSVFFPAWLWAKDPKKKLMYVTSTEELVSDSVGLLKRLVISSWYQSLFPEVQLITQQATKLISSKGGVYQGFGIQSSITGKGADIILLDDLISATNAVSQVELDKVNRIYDETIVSRLNSQKNGTKILIQQRLSTGDLIGHLLDKEKDKWEQLVIPMIFDQTRFKSSLGFVDTREKGELLWPERFDQEVIDSLRITLGERAFSAQYQQLPVPMVGGLFKRDWFNNRIDNTDVIWRFISADTASSVKEGSAYTSIIVGEITSEWKLFIRHISRRRMTLPEQVKEIEDLARKYHYGLGRIVIEAKSTGTSIIQTLESGSNEIKELLVPFNPVTDKVTRASQASVWCENGSVFLPPQANKDYPWLAEFEEELFNFPNTRFLDQVDSFSQLVIYVEHLLAEGLRMRNL